MRRKGFQSLLWLLLCAATVLAATAIGGLFAPVAWMVALIALGGVTLIWLNGPSERPASRSRDD